jgi:hypothetical protein
MSPPALCAFRNDTTKLYHTGDVDEFDVVRCKACRLVYMEDSPATPRSAASIPATVTTTTNHLFHTRFLKAAHSRRDSGTRSARRVRLGLRLRAHRRESPLRGMLAPAVPTLVATARDALLEVLLPRHVENGSLLEVGCGSGCTSRS